MTVSLNGVVALVTGAARGMGAEHVRGLVRAGARVVATDVLDDDGAALQAAIAAAPQEGNGTMTYRHLDVTDAAGWQAVVDETEATLGPIGVLVNNAGIVTFGSIDGLSVADWQRTIDINLTGVWLGMHHVVPSMKRAGGGSIVNISSTAGLQGYANLGAYVASKWGVRGLTKTAALELGAFGIRVNSIHPGPIRTPMIAGLPDDMAAAQPIARVGEPAEVTAMLMFIVQEATYSTGHEFIVDGGAIIGQLAPVGPAD
jgi:3alpha(or 20beta)-hydroxysteroid dehydrogenase